jgi:hypothetical protein
MYVSSLPPASHRGVVPPSLDTIHLPSGAGVPGGENARTYTSLRPDLLDTYATQRPSGENAPWDSLNSVIRKGNGLESPSIGNTHRSSLVFSAATVYNKNLPSRDQLVGVTVSLDLSNTFSSLAQFAGF